MRILDAHAHIGSWGDFLIPRPDADWLARILSDLGVEAAGISHMLGVGHDTDTGNRLALEAARAHPGRLYVWLVHSPHHPQSLAQLADQLDLPGVWGVKLHPDTHQVRLDDPAYAPLFAFASERGVPVLAHTQTDSLFSDPTVAATVARRWSMPLLAGHGGLWQYGLLRAARLAAEVDNLWFETGSSRLTRRWLARVVAEAGAEKVLYGSDALFLDPRTAVGRLLAADLSPSDRAAVAGGNLTRILGHRLLPPGGQP